MHGTTMGPEGHPAILDKPQIGLLGQVGDPMAQTLIDGLRRDDLGEGDIAIEITTQGGDPEMARRMILEVEKSRERTGKRILFFGKTEIYSAGVTFMAGFPIQDRFLTADSTLLIHCRQEERTIQLSGPIRASLPKLEAAKQQIEIGLRLESENFERLIEGSSVSLDELLEKALYNWYVPAEEALERGLIAGIVR